MHKLDDIIFCIYGKSGCGKTTIVDTLSEQNGWSVLTSYTTRPKRLETDTDHIYISEEEYSHLQNKVAMTRFDGNYYCATKEQVDESVLYVIDPFGIAQLKSLYDGNKKIVTIYIDTTMDTCLERMRNRGDKEDAIWERLRHDDKAFSHAKEIADYVINGNENNTYIYVDALIRQLCMTTALEYTE